MSFFEKVGLIVWNKLGLGSLAIYCYLNYCCFFALSCGAYVNIIIDLIIYLLSCVRVMTYMHILLTRQKILLWCLDEAWIDIVHFDWALSCHLYYCVTKWGFTNFNRLICALNYFFILIIPEWRAWNDIIDVSYHYSF